MVMVIVIVIAMVIVMVMVMIIVLIFLLQNSKVRRNRKALRKPKEQNDTEGETWLKNAEKDRTAKRTE